VVSDFDRTITRAFFEGQIVASSYGVIEHCGLLSPEYHKKITEYYNHYYPIETDPHLTLQEKSPSMVEWYTLANQQLVNEKVPVSLFDDMINACKVVFREKVHELLVILEENEIPLLVFSAGVANLIEKIFIHLEGRIYKNMLIVGNRVITDEKGIIIAFKEPIIHVFNKNEMALSHDGTGAWFETVSHRKNMILFGDSLGDVGMATGLSDPGVILKIGFLNQSIEANLPKYKELYDVVVINDGTFDFPNNLLKEIISKTK